MRSFTECIHFGVNEFENLLTRLSTSSGCFRASTSNLTMSILFYSLTNPIFYLYCVCYVIHYVLIIFMYSSVWITFHYF